jgi:DNA-directed RNA polymerase III subunit RPC3
MIRYAKFVEYIKKAVDFTASCCVEELLLAGRLRTVDLIVQAAEHAPKSDRYTVRQSVMDSFCKLVNAGFIERVSEIEYPTDDEDEGEFQFGEEPPPKRAKLNKFDDDDEFLQKGEDPAVIALLKANAHYKSTLPVDAVWRVNMAMFHDSLRAYYLGKLVAERYGHRVQSAGSLVTAALKYRAHLQYGARNNKKQDAALRTGVGDAQTTVFRPADMVKYLPKPVLQLLEKKTGGVSVNLNKSWQELSTLQNPQVVRHVGQDCFEIAVGSLANYLRDRIFYQVVHDRHGEVAARVVSILTVKGWLESDRLAEYAMVPAKDTREVLHHLYRSRYVELFQLSSGRQYNPANTIYLWGVDRARLMLKVKENVATALWNMRLRRDHEVEVGRNWIERAQQAADTDENAHETDKLNYKKFCLGLERLDVAALQLDETLMALCDF